MSSIKISHPNGKIQGTITLDGSKSISNRALIIKSLLNQEFEIEHLSTSQDTVVLQNGLNSEEELIDVGAAGTSFRFLTSYLAFKDGTQILTGSKRMLERPIGVLVDSLTELGARIEYLGEEGFPPIKIHKGKPKKLEEINIPANISSQYISALLLILPVYFPNTKINLEGKIVSKSYIDLTLNVMSHFGIDSKWDSNSIILSPGQYQAKPFNVEADWSAFSYYFIIAALSQEANLSIAGLSEKSWQGDSKIVDLGEIFGLDITNENGHWNIVKTKNPKAFFEYDFVEQPDIAQSLVVCCAALNIPGLFTGLETLKIKETNRIDALKTELAKFQVYFDKVSTRFMKKQSTETYMLEGKFQTNDRAEIKTYKDHRMAMSFAALALKQSLHIEDPNVVAKSYPEFWNDLEKLGFLIEKLD